MTLNHPNFTLWRAHHPDRHHGKRKPWSCLPRASRICTVGCHPRHPDHGTCGKGSKQDCDARPINFR